MVDCGDDPAHRGGRRLDRDFGRPHSSSKHAGLVRRVLRCRRCHGDPDAGNFMHATATALVAGHNHPQVLQVQRLPVYPDGKDHLFALELRRQLAQRQDGRVVCRSFSSGNIDTERLRERRIPRCATPVKIHIDSRSGLEPISRRSGIRRARTA